jgi:hypothetical protein
MTRRRWRALTALALLALQVMVPPLVAAADDDVIRAYRERLDAMEREMREMRERLRVLESERAGERAPAGAAVETAAPPAVQAAEPAKDADQDQKIGVLATEVERLKSKLVLPEGKEYKSLYGFGPAASKVYQVERGLSIGGYGEFNYQNFTRNENGRNDQFDFLRFVLYTGYKFSDRIVLNSEIEFEHATSGSTVTSGDGSVSVEFASLDFFLWEPFNVRAGLLLVPVGFLNEIHEPPFFFGNIRPSVEREIIPTTWREGGVGFFGTLAPGLDYRAYLMGSLSAEGYTSSGIRGGRQQGNRANFNDIAGTVRLDYTPIVGTKIGASFWAGDTGQNEDFGGSDADAFTLLWEAHAQVEYRGFWLRVLGTMVDIDEADVLSAALEDTIAESMFGLYAEVAYDVLPLLLPDTLQYLAPFFRYEIYDTQDQIPNGFARVPGRAVDVFAVGVSYKPMPQVVLKLDYRNFQNGNRNSLPDELNVGAGFIF